ncbi:MAG: cysteine desulfurase [Candidatus Rokubacteria bacterium]|nr:cysteine desulfurase [Candidatus Rokubacteria bacterium]
MARFTASSSARAGKLAGAAAGALRAYLDYGGFAPVDPRVLAVMGAFLEGGIGNPSAVHSLGHEAQRALEAARVKVARLVGGAVGGVIFTSGATEANNLAIKGVALRAAGGHVVTSSVEHISVLNPCRDLEKRGFTVTYLAVDGDGRVDPERFASAIRPDTVLASIQAANPEIGTVQPIAALARVARERGLPFHVDAVGVAGRIPLSVDELGIGLVTLSGNDLCGPPGTGALWVRPEVRFHPQILGGGQEGGYRSGTENLPAIVGMGVAAELARLEGQAEAGRLRELRDRLITGLLAAVSDCRLTGPRADRLPHHASVCLRGAKADSVLMDLDLSGVAASSGSACSSKTREPSHVLRAIGCDAEEAEGSLCFTLGRWTTAAEVEAVLSLLPSVVVRLRSLGLSRSAR